MSQATAQVLLTAMFLTGAVIFLLLDAPPLAAGCIGALAGQGATVGVQKAVNGNGKK